MTAVELAQDEVEQILKGITIPSPPQVIADLQMEMAMPDPDMGEIAKLVTKDASLAGSVLKTINSPFYSVHEVQSIQQAVMMLGMNTVMNIVNTVQLRDLTKFADDLTDEKQAVLNRFWDSAEDVAKTCMLIAKRLPFLDADMAYMLGLFHNAGIPLLLHKYPDYLQVIADSYKRDDGRIVDFENHEFSTNHSVVGYYVARSWKLPDIISQVIGLHHNAEAIFSEQSKEDTETIAYLAVLKMAENIAGLYNVLGEQDTDVEWQTIGAEALNRLGLSEPDYEDIVCEAREQAIGSHSFG